MTQPYTRAGAKQAKIDAANAGETFYSTGAPCKNGHESNRYTCTGVCVECQAEKMSRLIEKNHGKYLCKSRKKYEDNKEKIRKQTNERYHKDIEASRKRALADYYRSHEHNKARGRACAHRNKEKIAAQRSVSKQKRKDKIAEYNKEYRLKNLPMYASYERARYARIRKSMPPWVDRTDIDGFYELARKLTDTTGIDHNVDHIIPLQGKTVCGLHVPWNLRVITKRENIQKSNKLIEELT